jgi:hypothetical protein
MTDIWRSFVAQNILWSEGARLSFSPATVLQVRNQHNLIKDFQDEIPGYLDNKKICEILTDASSSWKGNMTIKSKVLSSWAALNDEKYVINEEMDILNLWMDSIKV